ncbi:MAG: hypothetical protein QXU87_04075 [Candidatus Caldarchaeum sp.]
MVNIPKYRTKKWNLNLHPNIDELLTKEAERRGISKTDLVESIIIEWAYKHGHNKILHVNFRNTTITIWDYLLNQTIDIVYDVRGRELFCTRCKDNECGHSWAVRQLPEVKARISS